MHKFNYYDRNSFRSRILTHDNRFSIRTVPVNVDVNAENFLQFLLAEHANIWKQIPLNLRRIAWGPVVWPPRCPLEQLL